MRYYPVYLLALLFTILIGACDSGPNLREPYKKPSQKQPTLQKPSVSAACNTDSTAAYATITIRGSNVTNVSLEVRTSEDSLIRSFEGLKSGESVRVDSLPGNGTYKAVASSKATGTSKSSSFSVDCVTLPGDINITRNTCVQGTDRRFDGEVTIKTEDELESWELENLDTGEIVRSDDPASGHKVEFEDLPDAEYKFRATTTHGDVDTVFIVDCDRAGPGKLTVNSSCKNENGRITVSSENGFRVATLYDSTGTKLSEVTGFDPENPDAEASFNGLADADYQVDVKRYGRRSARDTVKVACDRKIRRCTFSFTENVFVSGGAKHNEVGIQPSKAIVIHPKDNVFSDVTLKVRARMEEGESFFVELRPTDGGDVIRSDRFVRPDSVGPGDRWISSDKLKQILPLSEFEVDQEYQIFFITGDRGGNRNSVWFSDESRDGRVVLKYEFRGSNSQSKSLGSTELIPASQTNLGMPVLETKVQAKVIKK